MASSSHKTAPDHLDRRSAFGNDTGGEGRRAVSGGGDSVGSGGSGRGSCGRGDEGRLCSRVHSSPSSKTLAEREPILGRATRGLPISRLLKPSVRPVRPPFTFPSSSARGDEGAGSGDLEGAATPHPVGFPGFWGFRMRRCSGAGVPSWVSYSGNLNGNSSSSSKLHVPSADENVSHVMRGRGDDDETRCKLTVDAPKHVVPVLRVALG